MIICSKIAVAKCAIELDDFVEAERVVNDVVERMLLVTYDGDRYRLRTHVRVHMKSCTQLQRKRRLHRQLVDAFNDALDDSACSPPSQQDNWLHLHTKSSNDSLMPPSMGTASYNISSSQPNARDC